MFAGLSATWSWIILMVLLLVIEAAVPSLVSIWFAFGAFAAALSAAVKAPGWLQVGIFLIVSAASLVITRPLVKKYINTKTQPTNADMIIGKSCIVTEKIDNISGSGAIKFSGKTWTARSADSTVVINEGKIVIVERIEGVKAIVRIPDTAE